MSHLDSGDFIAIIPARLASTRLPNKPLADLAGKPMVVRTAERALASGAAQVIVATDDQSIADACQQHRLQVCMTRADHVSGTDRIAEVAQQLALPDTAVIVNVQGDEPLIDPLLIAATAACINAETPVASAAHRLDNLADVFNPNVVKVVLDQKQRAMYFSRAPIPWARDAFAASEQTMPVDYPALRHIGIYAYRRDFLRTFTELPASQLEQIEALEQLRILAHAYPIAIHISAQVPAAGVDTPEDLLRVQQIFATAK